MSQQCPQTQTVIVNDELRARIRCLRPDARREEFKTYLCNSGLMQQLSRALLQLYETKEKPANAVLFFIQAMGGEAPGGWERARDIENMLRTSEMQRGELARELDAVRNACQLQQQQMQQQLQDQQQQQPIVESYTEPEVVEPVPSSEQQVVEQMTSEQMTGGSVINETEIAQSEAGYANQQSMSESQSGQQMGESMTEEPSSEPVTQSSVGESSVSQQSESQQQSESAAGEESGRVVTQQSEVESAAVEEFWESRQSGTFTAETEVVTDTESVAEDPASDTVPVEFVSETEAADVAEELLEEAEEELGKRQKEMADDGKAKAEGKADEGGNAIDNYGINLESVHVQYEDEANEPLDDPDSKSEVSQSEVITSLTEQESRSSSVGGFGSRDSTDNFSSGTIDDPSSTENTLDNASSTGKSLDKVPSTEQTSGIEPGSTLDKITSSGADKVDSNAGSTGTEADGESQVDNFDLTASDAGFENPLTDNDDTVRSHSTALELIDLVEQTPSEKTEFSSTDKPS